MLKFANLIGSSTVAMVLFSLCSVPPGGVDREALARDIVEAFEYHPGAREYSRKEGLVRTPEREKRPVQAYLQEFGGLYRR